MSTVVVTLCDAPYFEKAKNTIHDLRGRGQWTGPIVLIAVDFTPDEEFIAKNSIQVKQFDRINVDYIIDIRRQFPFTEPSNDGREFKKVTQWEKLHCFDPFFKQWDRLIYFDAGLRILDSLEHFLNLEWQGRLLALDDGWNDPSKRFGRQLETIKQPDVLENFVKTYGSDVLDRSYFLNCVWIHDTSLPVTKEELIDVMNRFPIWRTNEMGVMNAVFTFKYNCWTPFPLTIPSGKYLFDWCELNRPGTHWTQYCALKYPVTL